MLRKLYISLFIVSNFLLVISNSSESYSFKSGNEKVKRRIIVHPKLLGTFRAKRGTKDGGISEETLQLSLGGDSEGFYLSLRKNEFLVTELGVIEWHFPNGTVQKVPLKNVLNIKETDKKEIDKNTDKWTSNNDCLFIGTVVGRKSSLAAVEVCDGYHGYIQIGTDGYIIRPLAEAIFSSESTQDHFFRENAESDHKTEAPHVLEFLAETLDNLNVRDDILSTEKIRHTTSKSEEEEEIESNVKDEFEEFLSTGKVRTESFFDKNEKNSDEEEKDFYEFLSTGKYREKSKENFYGKDNDFNEINSDLKHFLMKENRLFETAKSVEEKDDILSNDLEESSTNNRRFKRSSTRSVEAKTEVTRVDDYFALQDSLFGGSTWDGHYLGDIWSSGLGHSKPRYANRKNKLNDRPGQGRGQIICNGPYCEYYQVKKDDPKWLKLAVAVDTDVIAFHGTQTVKRYVLTLLNIMSAIYGDPTLGANLKFVILRLIFYEGNGNEDDDKAVGTSNVESSRAFDPIEEGNSKQSLENVNQWNDALWRSLPPDERHDAAIWLTRRNIGGPSGYAPVAGICDPARSCSLNRDEGLSSAFIIAHELGHILGMSHDGDMGAGNDCKEEASQGSVMAPMVGATFSYFHWSSCSAGEYHYKSTSWTCMQNYPHTVKNATFIGDVIEYTYSLDDQCRMEFGKGFRFCRSFQLNDPCTHLWCSHQQSPDICKTKKGPPMDGTECGKGLWCVSGYCESMEKRRTNKDGLRHNPRAGGWGPWASWGDCSRTCGTGVQFRSRQCDNPRPAYGGSPCLGDGEDFRLCNIESCPASVDFRALQCKHLFEVVSMDILARDLELGGLVDGSNIGRNFQTWFPYEHEEASFKCKLTCFSRDNGEYYQTGENVIDGTPCSYDNPSNICVQGKCIQLGCDKIIDSPVQEDECGICGGDGSKCRQKSRSFTKATTKTGTSKITMIPSGARNIKISFRSSENVTVSLKERDTNLVLVQGTDLLRRNRTSFVSEGTKFNYSRVRIGGISTTETEEEFISARGPILGPIVVLASSDNLNASFDAVINFTVSRVNEPLSTIQQYEWAIKGWSKCSKECGGGKQHLVMACVDKFTGRNIRKKLCGRRPASVGKNSRKCNNFGCDFSWVADRWEECSATCGMHGVRIRQTYCIPNNIIVKSNITALGEIGRDHEDYDEESADNSRPWMHMVNPKKCRGNRPPRIQECNRIPCPALWTPVGWSSCSATCGEGVERRQYECLPPEGGEIFFACGIEPISERKCFESACPEECVSDESTICREEVMKRYCVIPSYRKRCCVSCNETGDANVTF